MSEATFISLRKTDKKEFRVLIKHCFLAKRNTVEAETWLDKHYSDFASGKSTDEKWFAKFKRGEMSTEDDTRGGRPKEAVTDENINDIHKIFLDNRRVKLIEIAEALKMSMERIGDIVHECLGMRKLCSKWVRGELTIDQKQQ